MLSVRLRFDVEKKLLHLSEKTHRSKSHYVQQALETFLEEQAETLLAVAAYEEYLKSGKKGFSLEDMKQKYLQSDLVR